MGAAYGKTRPEAGTEVPRIRWTIVRTNRWRVRLRDARAALALSRSSKSFRRPAAPGCSRRRAHVTLQPNTQVLQRGDEVAGAYLVERGALRVYYVSAEGREGTLYWIDPGQSCILALNCLFARLGLSRVGRVRQLRDAGRGDLGRCLPRAILSRGGRSAIYTFDALATRLFDLMTLMQETASLGLEQRVAAHLLRRAGGAQVLETHPRADRASPGVLARSGLARSAQHRAKRRIEPVATLDHDSSTLQSSAVSSSEPRLGR